MKFNYVYENLPYFPCESKPVHFSIKPAPQSGLGTCGVVFNRHFLVAVRACTRLSLLSQQSFSFTPFIRRNKISSHKMVWLWPHGSLRYLLQLCNRLPFSCSTNKGQKYQTVTACCVPFCLHSMPDISNKIISV